MGRKVFFRGTTHIYHCFAANGLTRIRPKSGLYPCAVTGTSRQGLLLLQPGSSGTRVSHFPGYRFAAKPPALCNPREKATDPFIAIFTSILRIL